MVSTLVLGALLLVATITDVRSRRIYNWTTYPGIVLAVAANGAATLAGGEGSPDWSERLGCVGMADSVAGLVVCGLLMVVCYVFFAGGVGGGDVKLVAMIGAFLGPYRGVEATLWMFLLSACAALLFLVWRIGAVPLLVRAAQAVWSLVRWHSLPALSDAERARWKTDVFLSPSALVAVAIVQFQLLNW